MKILVINAGSSSLKYQLIDMNGEKVIAKGLCERITIDNGRLTHKANGKEYVFNQDMPTHKEAIELVLKALTDADCGVLKSMSEIDAVGHRMVHGGEDYNTSVIATDEVIKVCRDNIELAPLHNPANIMGIEACRAVMGDVKQVVVFDTAFHATMKPEAFLYGIPYEDYTNYRVRKYGFHGTSHMFVAGQAAEAMGKPIEELKIITCHLGNGSSIAAVECGKSVETSMGFTPLEGLPMGTRSGNIDPAAIEYLMNKHHFTISEMVQYLNKKSGMLGISGTSSDFRDLTEKDAFDNPRNKLAVEIFAYRVKKYIGEYTAAMNGVDAIVFTAGVGENTPYVREMACGSLQCLGVELDDEKNYNCPRGQVVEISKEESYVKVFVIPTNEELVIARETMRLCK
ncbi:MAG: acetate kinase [Clostridia bacterium]|nr:acetate kinase [Clostridia bacterium]